MGEVRAAASMWARSELRRRWRALVLLGVLAGVTGGVATAAFAGARRDDTAWDRLRAATNAADAVVFASQAGINDPAWDRIAELPYVTGAGAFGLAYGDGGGVIGNAYGDWLNGIDDHRIIDGRAPDPHDPTEAVTVRGTGAEVGDEYTVRFFTVEQQTAGRFDAPEGPTVTFEVVGISDAPFNIAVIPIGNDVSDPSAREALLLGPGFREEYGDGIYVFSNLFVRLEDHERDIRRLESEVAAMFPGRNVPVYDLAAAAKRVTNGTDLERSGLVLFAAGVALAGVVIVGQALIRSVRAAAADLPVLSAMGFTARDAAWAVGLPHALAAAVATVVSVVLAVALSPRFPIGLGRRLDPDVGVHVDAPVVLSGAGLLAVVLVAAVAATSWRAARFGEPVGTGRRSVVVAALQRAGAPVAVPIGASLALEAGRGRGALPTRAAVAGSVAGVLGLVGALTLGAGIADAVSNPERFGVVWDAEAYVESELDDTWDAAPGVLAADEDVAGVAHVARTPVPIGDVVVPFYAVEGDLDFAVVEGRAPDAPDEIALGPDTAGAVGVGVGDRIEAGAGASLRVVGLALLPTTPHSSFDQGGWVASVDVLGDVVGMAAIVEVAEAFGTPAPADEEELEYFLQALGFLAVTFDDGADADAAVARLDEALGDQLAVDIGSQPADQVTMRNVRGLPVLFAVFAVLLALGALAHLTTSVLRRRRGELAVLRSIGFTPRQARACLRWQASTLAAFGVLVGVPLGVALGRLAWQGVADAIPLVHVAPTAVVGTVLAVPLAFVAAQLVGAWPGRRVSRLRPAEALRVE